MTPPRPPGLRLHSRTMHVQSAEASLAMTLIKWQAEHDLTDIEMIRALLARAERLTTLMLRAERHPEDPDRKADEE